MCGIYKSKAKKRQDRRNAYLAGLSPEARAAAKVAKKAKDKAKKKARKAQKKAEVKGGTPNAPVATEEDRFAVGRESIVLFIARASAGKRKDNDERLLESLEATRVVFTRDYGATLGECHFLTYTVGSNLPVTHAGEVATKLRDLYEKAKSMSGRSILVVNGWDGLCTHPASATFEITAR